MNRTILKGTIFQVKDGQRYEILEDTTAHGCPFVIPVDQTNKRIGCMFAMTLYLHVSDSGFKIIEIDNNKNIDKVSRFSLMEIE